MATASTKYTRQKKTLIAVVSFVGLLFLAAFIINRAWEPILSSKLKKAVGKASGGLYTINFSSARVKVLEGKIFLYDINLQIDSAVYKRRQQQGTAPNNTVQLQVDRLILTHIHPFKLYFKKVVDIDRITLNGPDIHVSYHLNQVKDTTKTDPRTVWQKISKSLKYIRVGDIFLSDATLTHTDHTGKTPGVTRLKEVNIHANNLLIDSLTQTDTTRVLFCKEIIADINNYHASTPDGLYSYGFKRAKFSTLTSQLKVQGFSLKPAANFFAKTHKIRLAINVDSVILNNFDFNTYNKNKSFAASNLIIKRGSFDIFANPNRIRRHNDKIKSFPHVAIYQLETPVKLDSLQISMLDVSYSEHNAKSDRDGTITFTRTKANFYNITNHKAVLQHNNMLNAAVSSYFMGRARLDVNFAFNLTDKRASFKYKGHLAGMSLHALNPALVPFAMVKINSGSLKSFDFAFNANKDVFKGKVTLQYNDLKVSMLKNDEENQQLRKKFIVSMFANLFILKHNNPDKEGEAPRSFDVTFNRPVDHPFFKSIWKSMLAGIKPSVGFDEKTQRATDARIQHEKLKKENREKRKKERDAKRAKKEKEKQEEARLKRESAESNG